MADQDTSTKTLLSDLVGSVQTLVRQELRLAQAEGSEKVNQVAAGAIGMVAGMLVSFAALLVLLQALVAALAEHMATGWASLIVGVIVAAIGFGLIKYGQSSLKATNLVPERTVRQVRADADLAMEKVK
jgi:cytochrome c biogenesis protein CcdA